MTAPKDYRVYILDKNDHIVQRHDFEAENDSAAIENARPGLDGHDVEFWRRSHMVGKLKHTE